MINLEETYYLSNPIHKNSINIELTDEVEKNLVLSIDGSIMAVKRSVVDSYINNSDLLMIRMGFAKPTDEIIKYSDEDGFYKYLSCFVDLD